MRSLGYFLKNLDEQLSDAHLGKTDWRAKSVVHEKLARDPKTGDITDNQTGPMTVAQVVGELLDIGVTHINTGQFGVINLHDGKSRQQLFDAIIKIRKAMKKETSDNFRIYRQAFNQTKFEIITRPNSNVTEIPGKKFLDLIVRNDVMMATAEQEEQQQQSAETQKANQLPGRLPPRDVRGVLPQ